MRQCIGQRTGSSKGCLPENNYRKATKNMKDPHRTYHFVVISNDGKNEVRLQRQI